jgi:hypothetical protein
MVVKRMNKKEFLEAYEKHKDAKTLYVRLYIHMPDNSIEMILNMEGHNKVKYVDNTYDDELVHKNSKDIYIVKAEFISSDTLEFGFDTALAMLKTYNRRLARRGWNGKKQYIELAKRISYENAEGEIINANHDAMGNNAIAFVGTSGVQVGWLASQADMLADDWYVVDD